MMVANNPVIEQALEIPSDAVLHPAITPSFSTSHPLYPAMIDRFLLCYTPLAKT